MPPSRSVTSRMAHAVIIIINVNITIVPGTVC
jgi:hypothetical protein